MQENTLSFDELMDLASNDPTELENYRQQQIDAVINDAPEYLRPRLQGLQFQIDAQRTIHKSPLGVCIKLSQMMHESFNQLHDLLNACSNPGYSAEEALVKTAMGSAKVLSFPTQSRN